jgi:hypothetical protein
MEFDEISFLVSTRRQSDSGWPSPRVPSRTTSLRRHVRCAARLVADDRTENARMVAECASIVPIVRARLEQRRFGGHAPCDLAEGRSVSPIGQLVEAFFAPPGAGNPKHHCRFCSLLRVFDEIDGPAWSGASASRMRPGAIRIIRSRSPAQDPRHQQGLGRIGKR